MSDGLQERERIRMEYARRLAKPEDRQIYNLFNVAYQFFIQQRQRDTLQLLQQCGIRTLEDKRILELGCGRGDVLAEYLAYRIPSTQVHGMDLLPDRLVETQERFPGVRLLCADGQLLPYSSDSFDLVTQVTVFSSILSEEMKTNVAREMLRVLRKSGVIVWVDFWINPTNPQTKGIRQDEIRRLFPGCTYRFRKISLAPPLARKLVPVSWLLSGLLEKLKIFNTHYLVAIQKH